MTTAINANLNMPVTAADGTTAVNLTAKWQGTSSNSIHVEVMLGLQPLERRLLLLNYRVVSSTPQWILRLLRWVMFGRRLY